MKWKLMLLSTVFTAGVYFPDFRDKVKDWYVSPSEPPSAEALKLVRSLEDMDGWHTVKKEGISKHLLKKGEVQVKTDNFWADVYINDDCCNGQFSVVDLRAINNAACACTRRLAARAMDKSVRSNGSEKQGATIHHMQRDPYRSSD